MNNTAKLSIVKHTLYVSMLILLYVLQSVPGLFVFFDAKPIWTIPAAIAIAMYEGEFAGGVYGAIAGLLCDAGGNLLFGFNGIVATVCCVAAGLLVIYLMRRNIVTCLLFTLIAMLIRGSIEYFFAYGMWNYENSISIYTSSTILVAAFSAVVSVPVYYVVKTVHHRFSPYGDDELI